MHPTSYHCDGTGRDGGVYHHGTRTSGMAGHIHARDSTTFHPHLAGKRQNPHHDAGHFPNMDAQGMGAYDLAGEPAGAQRWKKNSTYREHYKHPQVRRQPLALGTAPRLNGERAQEAPHPAAGGVPDSLFNANNPMQKGTTGDIWSKAAHSSTYGEHFSGPGGLDHAARCNHANEVGNLLRRKGADAAARPADAEGSKFASYKSGRQQRPMLIKHSTHMDHFHGLQKEPARPANYVSLPDAHGKDVHLLLSPKGISAAKADGCARQKEATPPFGRRPG